jgi:uncharacterized protein (DUF1501 family)
LNTPEAITPEQQRAKLGFLEQVNRRYAQEHPGESELDARIASYELAFRMQAEAPGAVDLAKETDATKTLYGIGEKETDTFGKQCLLARRLVERGCRFVQLYHRGWDTHGASFGEDIVEKLPRLCQQTDKAVYALVTDLKQRGLLDDTLVVWGGEFGRTPMNEARNGSLFLGRDHHPRAFTMWVAGGGVKPGVTVGETDELGYNITRDPVDVHDLHATLLHLLGFDHKRLVYRHQGRDYRLTDVFGNVVQDLIA